MSDSEYKKDEKMPKNKTKMAPTNAFNHELIFDADGAKDSDHLFVAEPAREGEEVPEGSVGCFIPEDRKGLLQKISDDFDKIKLEMRSINNDLSSKLNSLTQNHIALNGEFNSLKEDHSTLNGKFTRLESDHAQLKNDKDEIYKQLQRSYAREFNNDVVHLLYALTHAKIVELLREKRSQYINFKFLRFEIILSHSTKKEKAKIMNDKTYKKLKSIMGSDFLDVVQKRNKEIHPEEIDIEAIRDKAKFIGSGQFLADDKKMAFMRAKTAFDEAIAMDDLDTLIELYKEDKNNSRI